MGWGSGQTREGRDRGAAHGPHGPHGRRGWMVSLALGCLAAVVIAGCAAQAKTSATPTKTAKTAPTITPTTGPTATPAPPTLQITDLGTFEQKLSNAFTSNTWANVAPFMSPELSLEWREAGSHLLMPYSLQNMRTLYENDGPWVASSYYTNFFSCYDGTTPANQIVGFLGNGGNYGGDFMMLGVTQWQGYWLVGWGFDNPLGSEDGFSCHIDGA